jgi:NAD(P)H-hydrate epimerase
MKTVTTAQSRQLDQLAIAAGVSGEQLMDRAGYAVARTTFHLVQSVAGRCVLLVAGKGNNGGDAIVAARHLASAGCQPVLAMLCRRHDLRGDALAHFQRLPPGIKIIENARLDDLREIQTELSPSAVVDGLLGTGLSGDVRDLYAEVIGWINTQRLLVVAIDIPSGLDGDTGAVHGVAVRADVTVTMGLPKIGLMRGGAPDFTGRIEVADIGFPRALVDAIGSDVELITAADIASLFPPRRRASHKGDYGHLLVVAGSEGYTGAPVLAAHAAARMGAGLVTLAVPRNVYPIVAGMCPAEIMPRPLDSIETLGPYDAFAIGPGMGQSPGTRESIFEWLTKSSVPVVVDADALNALAGDMSVLDRVTGPVVMTPHPGEMSRLTGASVAEVESDRWRMAREFARQRRVTLVLKGAGTVVAGDGGTLWINSTGNPGMARGGMGDVLTGMIGALLARGIAPLDAARSGVFLHGLAGDMARDRVGEEAMLAGDVIALMGEAIRSCSAV